jgi:hypothetical protein
MLHRTAGRWYVVPVPARSYQILAWAASSRTSIWATGGLDPSYTLIHWNGTRWETTAVPKQMRGILSTANGAAPGPHGSAWIVGGSGQSFSLHWNGKAWSPAAITAPGVNNGIEAVASIPGGTAWAVGSDGVNDNKSVPLVVHWSGKAWVITKTPQAGMYEGLSSVAAIAPSDAWAAGYICHIQHCPDTTTLILHWNGKTWS